MRQWLQRLEHGHGEHAEGARPGLPGVDVSNWQGAPGDWRTEAAPLEWAGVKMTELGTDGSRYVNPFAAADWAWLKAAGKGRIGYLYGHPSMSASATADLFAGAIRSLGVEDGDGIAVDMEVTNGLRAALVADWTATVLGLLQREFSRLPLVYTFLSFAEAGNCAGLGRYPLWIADISRPAGHPRVPHPWNTFAIHQYSWSPLDKDTAAYPSLAAMRQHLGKSGPPPLRKTSMEDRMFRVLSGSNADDGIALPDDAKTIRLGSVGETTVNVEFHGHEVIAGIKLGWTEGSHEEPVPADSRLVRVYRPAAGSPDVPVTLAVS